MGHDLLETLNSPNAVRIFDSRSWSSSSGSSSYPCFRKIRKRSLLSFTSLVSSWMRSSARAFAARLVVWRAFLRPLACAGDRFARFLADRLVERRRGDALRIDLSLG